jgi:hypothetical protein
MIHEKINQYEKITWNMIVMLAKNKLQEEESFFHAKLVDLGMLDLYFIYSRTTCYIMWSFDRPHND